MIMEKNSLNYNRKEIINLEIRRLIMSNKAGLFINYGFKINNIDNMGVKL